MQEYNVNARNTYNIDKKGFAIRVTTRPKRIVTKLIQASKQRIAAIQDSNRDQVILVACVCVDGDVLPPAIIFSGKARLQLGQINDTESEQYKVFSQT